jgi:uroporphyrinogen-III synthase
MLRILVTRPEPAARRTAARLAELGHRAVVLPLTETRPLPLGPDAPKGAVALAVTSANAVRHAPPALVAALAGLPCHAVGERTAEAARAAGFARVEAGSGGAEALAERIAPPLAGKALVYLCGRIRFPGFEKRLAAAGVRVHALESYDTVAVAYGDVEMAARLGGPVDAVLLYSAAAADAAVALAARPALSPLFAAADFLCLSQRVAARLSGLDAGRVRVARRPDEASLLALLPAGGAPSPSQRPFSPV